MVTRLFPYIRSWLLLCLVLLAPLGKVLAQNGLQVLGLQVPLGSTPSSFTQNFDALNSGITVNLAGLVGNVDGIYSNRTLILASSGAPDLVSAIVPTAGGYSFGTTSERALGSNANLLNSAVGLVPIRYGAMIQNNTGLPITSLTVTYTGEQWYRDGDGAAQTLFFEYVPLGTVGSGLLGSLLNSTFLLAGGIGEALNLGGITYTPVSVSALNFVSPNFTGGATTLNGNTAGNRTTRTATITVNIPAGGYILLRWTDPDDPEGFLDLIDTDHSLSVDDLVVSATTLNSPPTVTGTIPGQSVAIGSTVNIPTSGAFTEPDGQTLAYSATGLPTGLAINTTSGAITGTPSVTGVYPVTVRVSDPQGLSTSTTFSLTVNQPTTNVSTSGPVCAGQTLTLSGLLPLNLPVGAMVVLKGPNNFSVVVGGTGVVSIPTGAGGLPSGNYNLTLVASASLPLVGTVELLNLPVPVSILPLPALPTGLASQTAAVGSLLSLTGVCEAGSVLNYVTSTGLSGSSAAGIIPINTVSSGIQTVTALCVNLTNGCAGPSQLLNINVLNLIGDALNALPTAPVCLGQPLNLSLLGTGTVANLLNPLLSISIAGPNGFLVTTSQPGSVLSLTGLPAGTYNLTVTASVAGVPVPAIQVPVTVISLAPVTGLLASNTVVQNGLLTLVGSCPTGILSYSSSTGTSGTAISGIGLPINTGIAGAQSLTVVCLDPNGCLSVPTVANINVLAPVLNIVQGTLGCVGQATSLTLLPTNFLLNDPLVNVSITGPAGVTVGALGSNGVVSIGGLSTTATSLTVSVSIAGTPLINLPVSVSALPLPALPNLPTTLTALAGAPLSLSGLCPTGILAPLTNLTA
ncbi:Ig domain-containing protein, partial [Arsenicibacter rosenii]|uniref:Ig domain-containing protein n=1 Tax=Arsenicibacter rosenii TaxID=1750698 RepID=UPI000A79A9DC